MLFRRILTNYCQNIRKPYTSLPSFKFKNDNTDEIILGNENDKNLDITQHSDYFNVHNLFTIKDLFDARVHFGHKTSSLDERMKPFLFGSRLSHVIFDLNTTAYYLKKALNFAAHIAYNDGIILFISRNSSVTLLVENTAKECKEFAITRNWKLGIFTDSINTFGNIVRLPDLCIFLNTMEENGSQHVGVTESAKIFIPTIGIVDSNCNPNLITYPVPGNDDSIVSIKLYCELFKQAILRGKSKKIEHLKTQDKNSSTKVTNDQDKNENLT